MVVDAEDRFGQRVEAAVGVAGQFSHALLVLGVYAGADPLVAARRPQLARPGMDAVQLFVPVLDPGLDVAAPETDAQAIGDQPGAVGQRLAALALRAQRRQVDRHTRQAPRPAGFVATAAGSR